MPLQDTPALLRALADSGVRFIVVGGVAAIAHGATTFTRDLDVLAPFERSNIACLLAALLPLHPRFALHPQHPSLDQSIDELATFKNLYLVTDLGRLDILGAIPNGTFAEMAPTAVEMEVAGVRCAILGLDELIASKEALGREKDKLSELELRAIRDRLRAPTLGAREDRDDS